MGYVRTIYSTVMVAFLLASTFVTDLSAASTEIPDWVNFPGEDGKSITPEQAGLDAQEFDSAEKSPLLMGGVLDFVT